jgi:hypothetical protein
MVDINGGLFQGYFAGGDVVIDGLCECHLFVDQAIDCGDRLGRHNVGQDRHQKEKKDKASSHGILVKCPDG